MKYIFFTILLGFTIISCNKDDDKDDNSCNTTDITYTNTVAAIFNNSCATVGCHVDGNEANAFFSLEGYEKSKGAADFGRINGSINHETGFSPMPKNDDKLADCDIDKIEAWIADGSPE